MHMISAADVAFIGEALRTVYVGLWIVAAALVLAIVATCVLELLDKEHTDVDEDPEN